MATIKAEAETIAGQEPEVETRPARERLLDAAVTEFASHGFAGARIDRIAAAADINKQLIYHYFGGKKELYAQVLQHAVRQNRHLAGENERYLDRMLTRLRLSRDPLGQAWVRLLMFEALDADITQYVADDRQHTGRGKAYQKNVDAVLRAQQTGEIDPALDSRLVPFAMLGLSILPLLMPQWVGLAKGANPTDEDFLVKWEEFVTEIYGRLATPST